MKDSAWYHKIWLTKLNELPLKEDVDAAWTGMEQMLDEQLPLGNSFADTSANKSASARSPKPAGTTFATYLGYIVGAAAMVGLTTYFALHSPKQSKSNKRIQDKNIERLATDTLLSDSIEADRTSKETLNYRNVIPSPSDIVMAGNIRNTTTAIKRPVVLQKLSSTNTTLQETGNTNATDSYNSASTPVDSVPIALAPIDSRSTANSAAKASTNQLPADLSDNKKVPILTPPYNFGVETGLSRSNNQNTLHFGAFGSYALSQRWLLTMGIRGNTPRVFTGHYTRKSYFRPDSMPVFSFTDQRKVLTLDIPLSVAYKLSNTISINAGPMISLPLKQSGIKLGPIKLKTDTLMNTKVVYNILNNTKMNRINLGFSTGVSLHFSHFDFNARYQVLSPYNFSNEFGNNKFKSGSFQLGIGYRFK